MVTVCPATVKVPVLLDAVTSAETEYVTVPLPLPELPAVMEIHPALLTAVHAQPDRPRPSPNLRRRQARWSGSSG